MQYKIKVAENRGHLEDAADELVNRDVEEGAEITKTGLPTTHMLRHARTRSQGVKQKRWFYKAEQTFLDRFQEEGDS